MSYCRSTLWFPDLPFKKKKKITAATRVFSKQYLQRLFENTRQKKEVVSILITHPRFPSLVCMMHSYEC